MMRVRIFRIQVEKMINFMKIAGAKNHISIPKIIPAINFAERHRVYLAFALIFIISNLYLYLFGDYLFFYQENISLFVFSSQYLHQFVVKPGGLLEYAANFLVQGYFNTLYGSMILSAIISLLLLVIARINKRLSPGRSMSLLLILGPSWLLLLMQINFNWFMRNNLGFLLATIYFLLSILPGKKRKRFFTLALFPLFYYFAGAFAWIYLGMYTIYSLVYEKGMLRYFYPAFLLIIAGLSIIVCREVIFLQPLEVILLSPFSLRDQFMHPGILYVLIGFIVLFPLLVKLLSFVKMENQKDGAISLLSVLVVFITGVFLLSRLYDPRLANLFQLEKSVYEQDWDAVIEHQESVRLSNVVAQYYYNLALSEKDQLCDRMFFGPQDFGPRALIIAWDAKAGTNNIARGVYFYYAIGLINEAHRWAYESMVAQGYRPENMKLLIKTDLINGHYRMAEKYIHILKSTFHYRVWAEKYEAMLYRPDLIGSDPELGEKLKLMPKEDFSIRIRNPQTNIPPLLQGNPDNKKAFEYMIAWFLLEKNIGMVINEVQRMKEMSYTRIPKHIEEALIVYNTINIGMMPDLGGLLISEETIKSFRQYELFANPFTGFQPPNRKEMPKSIRGTYWFYLDARRQRENQNR
jgi:hypothetical protein